MDIIKALAHENRATLEHVIESRCKAVPVGDSCLLSRVLAKYRMYLDMNDTSLAPHLALDGYWEMWTTIAIASYVKPGMKVIDVGANFGYFTLLMADMVGDAGSVQAWEPNGRVVMLLNSSLRVNGMRERVDVVQGAAGQQKGTACLAVAGSDWGSARVAKKVTSGTGVTMDSLDNQWNGEPVDFIKIDAEGCEPEIWAGCEKLRAASPKLAVLLEFTPRYYEQPEAFLEELQQAGRVRRVAEDGSLLTSEPKSVLSSEMEMLWVDKP